MRSVIGTKLPPPFVERKMPPVELPTSIRFESTGEIAIAVTCPVFGMFQEKICVGPIDRQKCGGATAAASCVD
jgi:hypothetical protein